MSQMVMLHLGRRICVSENYIVSWEVNLCLGRLYCASKDEFVISLYFGVNDPMPRDRQYTILWYLAFIF